MSPLPLGIVASAGAAPAGAYELIQTVTSSGGVTQDITFSNLQTQASKYRHLQVRAVVKATGGDDLLRLVVNGSSSGYAYHSLGRTSYNTPPTSQGSSSSLDIRFDSMPQTADVFAALVLDITDAFSTNKAKTFRSLWGTTEGQFDPRAILLGSGLWTNTAQLTSLSFRTGNNTVFPVGVRFSLYGLKG